MCELPWMSRMCSGTLIWNTPTVLLTSLAVISSGLPVGLLAADTKARPSTDTSSGVLMYWMNCGAAGTDTSKTRMSPTRSSPTKA